MLAQMPVGGVQYSKHQRLTPEEIAGYHTLPAAKSIGLPSGCRKSGQQHRITKQQQMAQIQAKMQQNSRP
jgi:hypothetical protein